nr:NlpC/P60 family protein [Izhakiella capsodis]
MRLSLMLLILILSGCGSRYHAPPQNNHLTDSIRVISQLNEQLTQWHGTPYRYGGMSRGGVDCSGFVYLTMRDRFALKLPRTTEAQIAIGTRIPEGDLLPGDLVFFKTGAGESGLHVGIYDTNNQFIHASTSQGVIRSSLKNVYWKKKFWQARRL